MQIGRVLEALDANGMTENTIVIFTSDNGGERFADTWPFTGKKTELLEGGLRIPMVIAWPARIPPGRTSDQVAISMDWLPTLLAAAAPRRTRPIRPTASTCCRCSPPTPRRRAQAVLALQGECAARRTRSAITSSSKSSTTRFLFNVVEDPMERANLKERHKDVYDRIVAEWQAWNASMLPEIAESFTSLVHRRGARRPLRLAESKRGARSNRPFAPGCAVAVTVSIPARSV